MSQQPLNFRFSGKLARLLGRESVSSDTAALFELVKNGYDADAPKVTVTFENLVANNGKNARIVVEDTGDGMTYDDIVDKWMVVGTYSKETGNHHQGRPHSSWKQRRREIRHGEAGKEGDCNIATKYD